MNYFKIALSIFMLSAINCMLAFAESNNEITELKRQIFQQELEAANIEAENQSHMMVEWKEYGVDIGDAKKHRQEARKLQAEIEKIENAQ